MPKRRERGENSLYWEKRNGKKYWRAVVTLGYDEDNRQLRKTVSGYDKADVIKRMRELENKAYDIGLNLSFKGTVQELFKTWIFTVKQPEIQDLSFSKYEETYRLRLKDTKFGRTDIQDVSSILAQEHFIDMMKKYSENTCKRAKMQYKAFFDYLVDENILYKNPCKNVTIKKEVKEIDSYKCYTAEEQLKIINALDLSDSVEMMIYIAFASGLRLGELAALTWNDYKNGYLSVNKQYSRNAITHYDLTKDRASSVRNLKTSSSYRKVPLPESAQKALNEYKKQQLLKSPDTNLIFPNEEGTYQNLNRPTRRIKSICKKIDVEYISFHAIRHSYITRLFESKVDIKKVQKLAGHASVRTTLSIYTHVNKNMLEEAVESINDLF